MNNFKKYYLKNNGYISNAIENKKLTFEEYNNFIKEFDKLSESEIEIYKNQNTKMLLVKKEILNYFIINNILFHENFYIGRQIDNNLIKYLSWNLLYGFDKKPFCDEIALLQKSWDKVTQTEINKSLIGEYRKDNMEKRINGNDIYFTRFKFIPDLMDQNLEIFMKTINNPSSTIQIIFEAIWVFHLNFELIHPFVEGNGRVGRILADIMHIQNKLVPISFSKEGKKLYEEVINNLLGPLQSNFEKPKLFNALPIEFKKFIYNEFDREYQYTLEHEISFEINDLFPNSKTLLNIIK
ncbi:Fic family protein [Mesoplasma coleopterae]|uniref:Fic family protein n=1 Tax=Mesoplasma coleopterae TaxID=324078 RepID=UPI000D039F43|nr:Fic family protein [Mesoplasma coleopterae]AVN62716.1 hypothetical protein CG000_00090 [Mesoplasma coleopterae]